MSMEPFLVNPPIRRKAGGRRRSLLAFGLNPRRKKVRAKRRKRGGPKKGVVPPQLRAFLFKSGHRRKGATMKRRKHKKNPVVLGNPRRRKHSRRSSRSHRRRNPFVLGANPRRRSHRRYSRNPLSMSKLGLPSMKDVLFLGAGAFAGRIGIPQVLARVPMLNQNAVVRGFSRLGLVAAAGFLASKILKQNGKMFTIGLLANQVPEVLNDFLSLTGIKLADGNDELGFYTGGGYLPPAPAKGMGMYTLTEGDESGMSL
jgi:hypothetical protein